MTAKEFFKSTAFKCIAVLLSIVLICGILLTLCNALFFVTDEERTARAVAKVFPGEEVTYTQDEVAAKYADTASYSVSQAFTMTGSRKGQYLLNVTGKGGYSSGTVTCWILIEAVSGDTTNPGSFTGIEKVVVTANTNQSFINYIGEDDIQAVIDKQENNGFTNYDTSGIKTGATFSLGAIANAMNGAKTYTESVYCGLVQPFDGYLYTDLINRNATTVEVSGTDVTYHVTTGSNIEPSGFVIDITVGADGKISSYTIITNGSTGQSYSDLMADIVTLVTGKSQEELESLLTSNDIATGATHSNELCVHAALFAVANYTTALADYS